VVVLRVCERGELELKSHKFLLYSFRNTFGMNILLEAQQRNHHRHRNRSVLGFNSSSSPSSSFYDTFRKSGVAS